MTFVLPDAARDSRVPSDVYLNGREVQTLLNLAKYVSADPVLDPEEFCDEAARAAMALPARIREALRAFHRWGSPTGSLLISGFPVEAAPATPEDNSSDVGSRTILARIQAIMNESLGAMVAYEGEGAGLLFQDMVPASYAALSQTSMGSAVELEGHSEQAFSGLRPDFLSLACLRGDARALTYTLTARTLVARCSAAQIQALREPRWTTTIDASFLATTREFKAGHVRGPVPILSGAADDPFLLFDQDLMCGVDDEAQQLLEHVAHVYRTERALLVLKAGELLIVDNQRAVHGRSVFVPRFDGTDRFVIRSFVVRDLNRSRYAREGDSRTVAAAYS